MKRLIILLFTAAVLFSCIFSLNIAAGEEQIGMDLSGFNQKYYSRFYSDNITIYVYGWNRYVSPDSEEFQNVIKAFEDLTGIKVVLTAFDSNEDMYSQISKESTYYDIIIPSDYMVSRLVKEDRLASLNFDNIPNMNNVDDDFKGSDCAYDKNNVHSVPYAWSVLGLVCNTKSVDEKDADTWNVLWNSNYSDKIIMTDNSRDAFAIAETLLGFSVNTEKSEELDKAAKKLEEQKSLVSLYVGAVSQDNLEKANVFPCYACDYLALSEKNPDLRFSIPKEGTVLSEGALCILKDSESKEASEMFINFMCEPDVSAVIFSSSGYSTPMSSARELMDENKANNQAAYPSNEVMAKTQVYASLSDEATRIIDNYWARILHTNPLNTTFWTVVAVVAVAIVVVVLVVVTNKNKKMVARNEAA